MVLSLVPLALQLSLVLGYQALDLRLHALGAGSDSHRTENHALSNRDEEQEE